MPIVITSFAGTVGKGDKRDILTWCECDDHRAPRRIAVTRRHTSPSTTYKPPLQGPVGLAVLLIFTRSRRYAIPGFRKIAQHGEIINSIHQTFA